MQEPAKRMLILVIVLTIMGGGWWYFSKSSACEKKINYVPAGYYGGSSGEYYQACIGNPYNVGGCPKFATHKEAMSACLFD
jgi:hypothetical protein